MNYCIELNDLNKSYERFQMQDVNLSIHTGYITGLIGPNGAGKTTLIRMMMGMVRPDQGEVKLFGQKTDVDHAEHKGRIGYVSDESYYYQQLSVKQMKKIIAPFYSSWNEDTYQMYEEQFKLPPGKKIKDLSKGMKIKFSLAVALSHNAELLIMDEPTSGLDPVFRRELLDLLREQLQDERKSILFSTHNTTDLDRIADYIVFVNEGRVVFHETKDALAERYMLVKGGKELLDNDVRRMFVGLRENAHGFEGLAERKAESERYFQDHGICENPSLEEIMYFSVKGSASHV
ncbi:ABC transporter ATP-binding protein [Paenibacillus sp. NFR01]|uniref:ABC transporter ATP-binding protein n=1 Tax=Paenibacillus sp. NFR01 TaxID=1566279 RepID=UPI0008BD008D|nr:ABC transporter ATP-binding protein [Paenibacillus sp. NFR01]SET27960.1 ABC-2 type transport system ATP-binding protein [Paenibacillus sp. NFR01]